MSERGSGRTSRQLAALPDGGVYLVHTQAMVSYCQRLLNHIGRARDAVTFVTADLTERAIWGRRVSAWDVDHAYFDLVPRGRGLRACDCLELAAGRGPLDTQ
jgi:hypothetical protein